MFPALVEYMDSQDALRRLNNFTVRTVREQSSTYQSLQDELQQGGRPAPRFSPGEGFHLFVLDGRIMWMKREVQVAVKRFLAILEPALILGLAVLIGGIVFSILLGVMGMSELVQ